MSSVTVYIMRPGPARSSPGSLKSWALHFPRTRRACAPCTVASTSKCCLCACCSSTSCTSHLGERHPVRSFSFQLDRNFLAADKLHGPYSKHTIEWKFPLPVQELYSSFMGISIQRRSRGSNFGLGNLPGSRAGSANCMSGTAASSSWMVLVDR